MWASSCRSTTWTRSSGHDATNAGTSTIGRRYPDVTRSVGLVPASRRMGRRSPYSSAIASAAACQRALCSGSALAASRERRPNPTSNTRKPTPAPTIHPRMAHISSDGTRPTGAVCRGVADSWACAAFATTGDADDPLKLTLPCGCSSCTLTILTKCTSQAGTSHSAAGIAAADTIAAESTRWRSAAGRLRRQRFATSANATIADAFSALSNILARLRDEFRDSVQLFVRQSCAFTAEQRRHGLLGGAVEECVHEMSKRRFASGAARSGRHIHVAHAVLFVPHVSLVLEHAQLGPDGGITGVSAQIAHDLGRRRAAAAIQDVHDLTFAPAQLVRPRHVLFL